MERWTDNRSIGSFLLCASHGQHSNRSSGQGGIVRSTQEDHRARFYEQYRKEAREYDEDFTKKYHEDMGSTLIFVCLEDDVVNVY